MTTSNNPKPFDEKRKDIRYSCQKLADVYIGGHRFSGCIKDESKGGLFIETRGSFMMGDEVVVIYGSPKGMSMKRSGKIVKIIPKGIGIKLNWPGYNR
jgi:hypothetical protein